MPQLALPPETIASAKELRKQGQSIASIASELGISQGSAWNVTRGIKPARRRRPESPKEGVKPRRESKDIMGATAGARLDSDTIDLANRVRKARLQAELDEIDDRKQQRQEVEDLRLRERRILLELDTARQGAAKGESAVVGELTELRRELSELREARHQAEVRQMEDRHSSEMRRLEQLVASTRQAGLGAYDIMARSLDKAENLAILAAGKVDSFVKSGREDKQLMTALSLGMTPDEYALLLQGEELVPTREDFEVGRRYRAHKDGVPLEEPEPGEFEGLVRLVQQRNRRWQNAMDKVHLRMQGGSPVVKTGKPGKAPAPGEPEPVVLPANSKVVKCQRCGSTFDVDLNEARQYAAQGKKLFVNCAKCNFLLEITEMIPELKPVEVKKPACYVTGQDGQCGSELRGPEQCVNCQWFESTLVPMVYE